MQTLVDNNQERTKVESRVREKALRLLARREHSRYELEQKLQGYHEHMDLDGLLDQLQSLGLQSDYRYFELLVRSKSNAGYGLKRIQQWAFLQGLSNDLLDDVLLQQNIDWFAVALQQKRKHFGVALAGDSISRSKQLKYLYNRGFSQDQISYAISCEHNLD